MKFFIVVIALYLLANVYLFVRGFNSVPHGAGRIVFSVVFILLSVTFFGAMFLEDKMPVKLTSVLQHAGSTWLFSFIYLVPIVLLLDLIRLINKYSGFLPDFFTTNPNARLYVFLSVIGVIVILFIYGIIHYNNPAVEKLEAKTTKNVQQKQRIVVASDIHLGYTNGIRKLKDFVKIINDQNPDIVLLCGDTFDRSLRPIKEKNMVAELKNIKGKVYIISGNHEYYGNREGAFKLFADAGFTVLSDSVAIPTNDIYIVGRDDRTNKDRKPLNDLVSGLDHNKVIIVMDHQPYHLEEAEQAGVDFQFSGHTHDGQVFPINLITNRVYEKAYGYLKKGNTQYYITSGLGLWGPHLRIGTRSEIVVLDL